MPKNALNQKRSAVVFPKNRKVLEQLGDNIKLACKRRGYTQVLISERTGLSRLTIRKIEQGDPKVSIGHYVAVLSVLGLTEDFARVANDDELGRKLQDIKLMSPGSSLGGARPKASVVDENNQLWIAKFPSLHDDHDIAAWEFVVYQLAVGADIQMAECRIDKFKSHHHTFLTKRFDRTPDSRLHFTSAMTQLGYCDGDYDASYQVGIIQSLLVTCKLHDVNPYEYFVDVLQRVGTHPASRVEELTPRLWKNVLRTAPCALIWRHLRMADKAAYQQWQESAEKAKSISADNSLELWQKVHKVNEAYSGLALEGLQSKHRHKILTGFGKVNAVFTGYTLNSFDDYEKINESDLRKIIKIVNSLAPPRSKK